MSLLLGATYQATPEPIAPYRAEAVATNYIVYRQAVMDYYDANPAASGTINDGALTFPIAYQKMEAWTNSRSSPAAAIYVYGPDDHNAVLHVVTKLDHPINTGIERSNSLWSPIRGDLGVPIPGAIPNGSLVTAFDR